MTWIINEKIKRVLETFKTPKSIAEVSGVIGEHRANLYEYKKYFEVRDLIKETEVSIKIGKKKPVKRIKFMLTEKGKETVELLNKLQEILK